MLLGGVCLVVLFGFSALAADMARARTARAELQAVTDSAARYAASSMRTMAGNQSAANANAAVVFAENKVDGTALSFNPSTELELGIWNKGSRKFTVATVDAGANAVRIRKSLTLGDSARPLAVAGAIGKQVTITAESIAMLTGETTSSYVSAKGNPWLAGMPNGTLTQNLRPDNSVVWDTAGKNANDASSPGMINLKTAKMSAGQTISFDSVNGLAGYGGGSNGATDTADGNQGMIVNLGTANGTGASNWPTPVNGISNVRAPINAMIAVFLTDAAPNTTAAPSALDFTSTTARDYTTIAPQLKQAFFIGDGRRSTGEAQKIVIPAGATRLFIGNMDAWQWNDNVGGYTATVNSTVSVSTVK